MAKVYLGLGTNVGRLKDNFKKAITLLKECGLNVLKQSSMFKTKAISKVQQRDYLNMCIEVETGFTPEKIFKICQMVEKQMGRPKEKKKKGFEKPRIIDIDILLYDKKIIKKRNLKIPHLNMHKRLFVLEPLNEIAPHIMHPVQQKTIKMLLKECLN
jgi:2-amino-4-hydroxy-6-hydroxymethyldihydropteridine diphosphokinase